MELNVSVSKAWLKNQVGKSLVLPDDIKDSVAVLRPLLDLEDIQTWAGIGSVKFKVDAYSELSLTGTLEAIPGLKVVLELLTGLSRPKPDSPVVGIAVTIGLSKTHEQFVFLHDLDLIAPSLRFEARKAGQSNWKSLSVHASLRLGANTPAIDISCELGFTGKRTRYDFLIRRADGGRFSLAGACASLGIDLEGVGDLLPDVGALWLSFTPATKRIAVFPDVTDAKPLGFPWALAILGKQKSGKRPVVASARLSLGDKARLSRLDLLKGVVPPQADLALKSLTIAASSQPLSREEASEANNVLKEHSAPALPDAGMARGLTLSVQAQIVQDHVTLTLRPRAKQEQTLVLGADLPTDRADSNEPIAEVALVRIERPLGPLHIRQVALRIDPPTASRPAARLVLGIDAALIAAGIALEATGLGIAVELKKDPGIEVLLRGLGVAYSRDPLHVLGAVTRRPDDAQYAYAYDGLLMVKAATWGFLAVGSYARLKNPAYTSLFVFGAMEGRISGPPPVVFTGLCLGFGYNSRINLPAPDDVAAFPFVKALGNMKSLTGEDPVTATRVLEKVTGGEGAAVVPQDGTLWVAAGLAFSVAEILQVSGLLVVQVGPDFSAALIGTCTADFPARKDGKDTTPRAAHIELGFRALYEHTERRFSLTAALSDNSWLVHPDCRLTGGAALFLWFSGSDYEGDFVATVGGYHPRYTRPAHYPDVPRLALNWSVSSAVSITGELYVAVTPAVGMVGGRLEVRYNAGGLSAWLVAYFNVAVWWAPLSFRAEIGITIGASYTIDVLGFSKTIRCEISATLDVWGPPTGGRARLKVGPFSVSIEFGEKEHQVRQAPLTWTEFRSRQLPAAPFGISALDGLLTDPVKASDIRADHWVVASDGFSFATRTAIPATHITMTTSAGAANVPLADMVPIGPKGEERPRRTVLDIAPMRAKGTNHTAVHHVTVIGKGADETPISTKDWTVVPQYAPVPTALWTAPGHAPALPDGKRPETAVYATGLVVSAPPPSTRGRTVTTTMGRLKGAPATSAANPFRRTASSLPDADPPSDDKAVERAALKKTLTKLKLLEAAQ